MRTCYQATDLLRETRERSLTPRSIAEVALAAGVSAPYISQVERGKRTVSPLMSIRLADEYGLPRDDAFTPVLRDLVRRRPEPRSAVTAEG